MGEFMTKNVKCLAAGLLLSVALPVSVLAEKAAAPVVSQTAAVEGGRALQVVVAQSEIKSDINPSNIARNFPVRLSLPDRQQPRISCARNVGLRMIAGSQSNCP